MKNKDFYIHLGRLLYAVAMADGVVQDAELQELYKLVVKDLQDAELFGKEDEVDSFYTEFEFEALLSKNADRQDAFQSFLTFMDENQDLFTGKMKEKSLLAVKQIASSFEGIVPEEQLILDKLMQKVNEFK